MAIKTFTSGEVLTASDTNTYLANGGLVSLQEVTIGAAAASVTVTNAFSSTYNSYRIVITGTSCNAGGAFLYFQFTGLTSSGYNGAYSAWYFTGGNTVTNLNNTGYFIVGGLDTGTGNSTSFDVYAPQQAKRKSISGTAHGNGSAAVFGGQVVTSNQETGFIITPSASTMNGGTILLMGYRKV